MINNFKELVILIDRCEAQIAEIKSEINYYVWKSDFKKVVALEAKEILIQKRIQDYIQEYKAKVKNEHLEFKIFGSMLEVLEKMYPNKTIDS